jgi:hypothetical protein
MNFNQVVDHGHKVFNSGLTLQVNLVAGIIKGFDSYINFVQ